MSVYVNDPSYYDTSPINMLEGFDLKALDDKNKQAEIDEKEENESKSNVNSGSDDSKSTQADSQDDSASESDYIPVKTFGESVIESIVSKCNL